MRRVIGIGCIALGITCILASVGIAVYNRWEDKKAEESAQLLLQSVQLAIDAEDDARESPDKLEEDSQGEVNPEMPTIIVKGYKCIGILSIPVLELELPVFSDWSYEKLRVAPCHYFGSYISGDLVIAGHNYQSHFGRLSGLKPKDIILFEDAAGNIHEYEVVLLETLPPNATENMISSGFALSLYTCTPGGANRVTVRCKAAE